MRFIQVTDTHVVPNGKDLYGIDPNQRLMDCVYNINQYEKNVEFCVFTGDLADGGDVESYNMLREILQDLTLPYYLMIGNHDRREAFFEVFTQIKPDPSGHLQYSLSTPEGLFLFLDTVDEGKHSGLYCKNRQQWLANQLSVHANSPIYLFSHHPPFDIFLPSLDRMKLANPEDLLDTLSSYNIRHLFFGHVHRALNGSWHGIPFSALPSTVHQIATDFETSSPMPYSHGPPAYAFVDVTESSTLVNLHNYLHQNPRQLPDRTWST